jgi:hypothetical protein
MGELKKKILKIYKEIEKKIINEQRKQKLKEKKMQPLFRFWSLGQIIVIAFAINVE